MIVTVNAFRRFVLATELLANVAAKSEEFGDREKEAARALYRNALSAASVPECRQAFGAAYRILGAPGDFGYDSAEGQAMKTVYEAWNAALAVKPLFLRHTQALLFDGTEWPEYFVPNRKLCEEIAVDGAWTPLCTTILDLMLSGF